MNRDLQSGPAHGTHQPSTSVGDPQPQHEADDDQRKASAASSAIVQRKAHDIAARGLSGGGGALPHGDAIRASFGGHARALDGVDAHVGGQAADAAGQLGAQAYAYGNSVAFNAQPDLHTAAHEAAHVVQQREGVQVKGGVGERGDRYEQNADAVADRVVQGKSAQDLLDHTAGGGGATAGVQSKAVQLLGVPLDQELPPSQEAPAHGEEKGEQRKWSPQQYIEMWEQEQGRKITPEERATIDRGCIGITALNLQGGGNPLAAAEKIYGSFEQAHAAMVERNKTLDLLSKIPLIGSFFASKARYVMFAKLFWSNQSSKWEDRFKPDEKAYKPDPKTGEVDMTGYNYEPQSKWDVDENGKKVKSSYINFDYGFWDEPSSCFWHANHMDYGDPDDPMIVLQSTKDKFAAGYFDFDRIVYCIAKAENYNPGLAAIAHAGSGG
jgi:hypothetical protein